MLRPGLIPGGNGVRDAASGVLQVIGRSQRGTKKAERNMRGPRSQEAWLGLVVLLFAKKGPTIRYSAKA